MTIYFLRFIYLMYRNQNMITSNQRNPQRKAKNHSQTIVLPENFAQMVMELQMQVQFSESSTLEVVQRLNELYSMAIQHYINEDMRKLQHFQRKLNTLLTHPNTLQVIENRNNVKNLKTGNGPASYNDSLKHELNKFNYQSSILVKSMLEGSEYKVQKNSCLIKENIQNQEETLRLRLQARNRSKSDRVSIR